MTQDIKPLLARYEFLIQVLKEMLVLTEAAMKGDTRWFSFAPMLTRKFLNQAFTLNILFQGVVIEESEGDEYEHTDISSIYAILRMLFETHSAYYHLFMPCTDIEENILRFRLWELDGLRARVNFKRDLIPEETQELIAADTAYILKIESAIKEISYFKKLTEKQQKELLDKCIWKFSSTSLLKEKRYWSTSISDMIKIAGLKEIYQIDLYSHFSMHTHPLYLGVIQNELTTKETYEAKFVAAMLGGFVTAFMIEDLAHRFVQPKEYLNNMEKSKFEIFQSVLKGGRS